MTDPTIRRDPLNYFIGAFVIVLALFNVGQAYIDYQDRQAQQDCLEKKFSEFTTALNARGNLTGKESDATKSVINFVAEAAAAPAKTPAGKKRQEEEFQRVLANYSSTVADVNRVRKENPFPPYPVGTCQS